MMLARLRPVVCTAQPFKPKPKTIVRPRHVKESIQHARLLCQNYEDTVECKLAWEKVEELSAALNDQKKLLEEEAQRFSEYEERIYDL
jgi:lipid II:glycine glycyltransferase (peptidoglycan interpeptide bridge formation enzyme)